VIIIRVARFPVQEAVSGGHGLPIMGVEDRAARRKIHNEAPKRFAINYEPECIPCPKAKVVGSTAGRQVGAKREAEGFVISTTDAQDNNRGLGPDSKNTAREGPGRGRGPEAPLDRPRVGCALEVDVRSHRCSASSRGGHQDVAQVKSYLGQQGAQDV
jgi:hypothetical protein